MLKKVVEYEIISQILLSLPLIYESISVSLNIKCTIALASIKLTAMMSIILVGVAMAAYSPILLAN
jgi:hypothetical protein